MIRRVLSLLVSSVLLATLPVVLGPTAAQASWAPSTEMTIDFNASDTLVDSGLTSHLAWPATVSGSRVLMVSHRPPGEGWSAPRQFPVGGRHVRSVQLAEAANGTVVLMWNVYDGATEWLYSAWRAADGTWSSAEQLTSVASTTSLFPSLVANRHGDVALVWREPTRLLARFAPRGQRWGPALDFGSHHALYGIAIGIDDAGLVTMAWPWVLSESSAVVAAYDIKVTATAATDRVPSLLNGGTKVSVRLAVGAGGHRTIAVQADNTASPPGPWSVYRRAPGGAWGSAEPLGSAADLGLAITPDGTTVAAARRSSALTAITAPAGGPWFETTLAATGDAMIEDLEVDRSDGSVLLATSEAVQSSPQLVISGRFRRLSGGVWSPARVLHTPTPGTWTRLQASSYGGHLNATSMVFGLNGGGTRTFTTPWDPYAPVVTTTVIPAAFIDQPATFQVTAADFTPVKAVWDFGDGTTAEGLAVTHTYGVGGVYPVTVTVTDAAGNSTAKTGTSHVTREGVVPPSPGVAPQITALKLSRTKISVSRKPRATKARVTLSTDAKVTLAFRKKGSRKVLRRTVDLKAGKSTVRITARLSRKLRLKPGRWTITARARNAYGTSKPRRVRLRVVR